MAMFVFRDRPNALLQVHIYLSREICQCRSRLYFLHSFFSTICYGRRINLHMSLFHTITSLLKVVLRVKFLNVEDYISDSAQTVTFDLCLQLSPCELHMLRGGGFYEPCSNRYECCYPLCSGLFRNDTPQHPEGVEKVPVTVDSSNFRVACKRQYLVKLLHTHVMDFPLRGLDWYLSGGKTWKWLEALLHSLGRSQDNTLSRLMLQPEKILLCSTVRCI